MFFKEAIYLEFIAVLYFYGWRSADKWEMRNEKWEMRNDHLPI